jgi:hypothetical protein
LPFSLCESGMLREAPIGTKGLRTGGTGQAGHRTFGSRTSPAEGGTSVRALPPAREKLRLRQGRAGPGFGPGAANPAMTQGLAPMDLPGGTKASALDPAGRGTEGFGRKCPPKQEEKLRLRNRQRRTARASALSGSPRGNLRALRRRMDPGGSGTLAWPLGALALVSAPRNRPSREKLFRQDRARRDSGGRQRCRPPLFFGRTRIQPRESRRRIYSSIPTDSQSPRNASIRASSSITDMCIGIQSTAMSKRRPRSRVKRMPASTSQ